MSVKEEKRSAIKASHLFEKKKKKNTISARICVGKYPKALVVESQRKKSSFESILHESTINGFTHLRVYM